MRVMRTYLGCLTVVVLSLVACGGTSDTSNQSGGGSSAGGAGSASAGHNNGAGASAGGAAGNTSGGTSSAGTGAGGRDGTSGTGFGGTLGNGGSAGSSGSGGSGGRAVDARCPAQRPMGACGADDAGLACQYDNVSGCLCYPSVAGTYTPCQKVDPTCPSTAAPAPADGAGGASGKIAPPPQQVCSCSASAWSCHF
jgi:hypothetical protein